MLLKTTMIQPLILVGIAVIKNSKQTNASKDAQKEELLLTTGGNIN
jgi:hypothetical protein